jgi:hypothetical protein
LKRVDRKRPR